MTLGNKMELHASSSRQTARGLWDCPRVPQYSKETQDMLKLMMQESRLTNFQQRQLNNVVKMGAALPLTCNPTSSAPASQNKAKSIKTASKHLPETRQRRSYERCCSGDNYIREKFRPSATRDLEKEKRRLQNILATGQAEPKPARHVPVDQNPEEVTKDRFQEVLDEIEDRRQFLAEMTELGKEKQYQDFINTEISQKIRELEVIDKVRSAQMKTQIPNARKLETRQQDMDGTDQDEKGETITDSQQI